MMKYAEVEARLAELDEFLREQTTYEAIDVLRELELIAFARADDFFHWRQEAEREFVRDEVTGEEREIEYTRGTQVDLIPSDQIDPDKMAAVKSISQTVTQHGGTIRMEFHNKKDALELLGRFHGLWTKDATSDPDKTPWPELMLEAAKNADAEGLTLH